VVPSTAELELRAVTDWIAEYGDQSFSLTDAVSFVVMKSRKITGALTLDSHFAVAGFTTEPATARPIRRKR
jgi:predicted nucleic acid-binding protein